MEGFGFDSIYKGRQISVIKLLCLSIDVNVDNLLDVQTIQFTVLVLAL